MLVAFFESVSWILYGRGLHWPGAELNDFRTGCGEAVPIPHLERITALKIIVMESQVFGLLGSWRTDIIEC
jgi:hypothetical protein